MFELLGGIGLLGSICWYFKNRLDTISDNHLEHVQESLNRIEKELKDFIKEHLTLHIKG